MRAALAALALLATGCSAIVGDHPFSTLPKAEFGKREKFNPGNSLQAWLSIPPVALATERIQGHAARRVVLFVVVRHPRGPFEGVTIKLRVNGQKTYVFPTTPDHSWSFTAPFAHGFHVLEVEVVQAGQVVYTRRVEFYVIDQAVLEKESGRW